MYLNHGLKAEQKHKIRNRNTKLQNKKLKTRNRNLNDRDHSIKAKEPFLALFRETKNHYCVLQLIKL